MKIEFRTVVAVAATAVLFAAPAAQAAEIKLLSSNGVTAVMKELGPEFERTTGHRIAVRFDAAAILRKQSGAGGACGLAILTGPRRAAQQGGATPDPRGRGPCCSRCCSAAAAARSSIRCGPSCRASGRCGWSPATSATRAA